MDHGAREVGVDPTHWKWRAVPTPEGAALGRRGREAVTAALLYMNASLISVLLSTFLLARKVSQMSQAFDALKTEVSAAKSAMANAAGLIATLLAKIPNPENVVDPVEVTAVTSDLAASTVALDAAVTAATPPVAP